MVGRVTVGERWTIEQVATVAPAPSALAAAEGLAIPSRWNGLGADERGVWGRCRGSGAEPYETSVDHVTVGWRCSCPSRRLPCKHALALLLLWARDLVPSATAPAGVARWLDERARRAAATAAGGGQGGAAGTGSSGDTGTAGEATPDAPQPDAGGDADRARDERVARMYAGLIELDRWLEDRVRTGLADPSLARYATWDDLAARLVDARAGALANRIRRLAGLVGASPDWHADVLAELGILHLVAQAGRRLNDLPGALADAVATVAGWQVRQADVLAGVPETDTWLVAGRSDTREDRIEVRRTWLRGVESGRWAMVLSFAAYRQSLDRSLEVGTTITADLHRYPGGSLRALVGERSGEPVRAAGVRASTLAAACDEIGAMVAAEPWAERLPATVLAALGMHDRRWVLADATGSVPVLAGAVGVATVLAATAGAPVPLTVEWTPHGVVPLTVHLADRAVDVGPRADLSFVAAA
jgi:SWIM zinc finger